MLAGDNGPQPKANSTSVTFATDDPGLAALEGGSTAANQATANTKLDSIRTDLAALDTSVKRLAPLGPGPGSATASASKIFNVGFSASGAQSIDLNGVGYVGLKAAIDAGKLLMLKATSLVWYHWNTTNVNVSTTANAVASPTLQAVPIFDGGESPERAPVGTTYLNLRGGPVDGMLCIYIAE